MADENDLNINITGNASGVKSASDQAKSAMGGVANAAKNIEQAFKTVAGAIDPTFVALERYNKAQAANALLLKEGKIGATEWANQQVRLRQVYDDQVEAIQRKIAAHRAETQAQRQATEAAEEKARAERASAAAAQDLRASIDPAFAAQQRYNTVMQQATQLLMQGRLRQGEWTAIQRQAKTQMDINVRSLGRMNSMYVQLGYQAQDVTASLASGISPLVILAQQGGQTAAALSTMGGTVGRVAAFFAGPWGAAIIGATLLLGYMMDANKKAKDTTVDLMDAESRRAASLPDLTKAIEDFTKAQREANISEAESLRLKGLMVEATQAEQQGALAQAQKKLADLEAQYRLVASAPKVGNMGELVKLGLLASLSFQIDRAKSKVKELQGQLETLGEGGTQLEITEGIRDAEAAVDELVAAKQRHQAVMDRLVNSETQERNLTKSLYAGKVQDAKIEEIRLRYLKQRTEELKRFGAEEERIRDARRKDKTKGPGENTSQFIMPVSGRITGQFGESRPGHMHGGIDIAAELGTPIKAAADGVVEFAKIAGDYGNLIKVMHGANTETRYAHLQSFAVQEGQRVQQGQVIGYTGGAKGAPGAGNSGGPHLHYEVRVNGKVVDPKKGIFGIDQLEQEEAALKAQQAAAQDAFESKVSQLEFEQTLAGEDLDQVAALQEQKIELVKQFHGEESKEAIRASRELILINRRREQQILADSKAILAQQLQAAEETEKARAALMEIDRDIKMDNVSTAESTGMINAEQARLQKAQILDQEYQDQQAHEEKMYQLKLMYLRQSLMLPDISLEEQRRINDALEDLERQHLVNMANMNAQYQRDVNRIRNEAFAQQTSKWREMAGTITGSMRQAFTGIWTHQTTFFQTMVNMADAIVYKFADMGEKILQDWLVKQAVKLGLIPAQEAQETAMHAAGESARTTVTATGEATRQGIGAAGVLAKAGQETAKTTAAVTSEAIQTGAKATGEATRGTVGAAGAVAEIGTRAATSAAGAYSSTVVIPFIGPVAAPVAAAAALAAVLGFAALVSARGGQERVPVDGQITELHKDEMVLPAWIANPMRDSLRNPMQKSVSIVGGMQMAGADARAATHANSSTTNFFYQPKHTNMGAGFDELLRNDGRTLRKWIRNELRNGNMA